MRTIVPALALLGCLSVPGCGVRTPSSLCQEYVDSLNDMLSRCGITDSRPITVRWSDGRIGCEHATRVSDADRVVHECIPWAENVECSEVEISTSGELVVLSGCETGLFQANAR